MRALTRALYERLVGDADVTAAIQLYKSGPAVFAGRLVPADISLTGGAKPYLHIRVATSEVPFDTLTREGRDVSVDIAAYAADTGSEGAMDDLAERVRDLLHHQHLPVDGWHTVLVTATGPQDAPEEPGFTGRIVSVRVLLQRL